MLGQHLPIALRYLKISVRVYLVIVFPLFDSLSKFHLAIGFSPLVNRWRKIGEPWSAPHALVLLAALYAPVCLQCVENVSTFASVHICKG